MYRFEALRAVRLCVPLMSLGDRHTFERDLANKEHQRQHTRMHAPCALGARGSGRWLRHRGVPVCPRRGARHRSVLPPLLRLTAARGAMQPAEEDAKPIIIPVPPVTRVPTYAVDYLPIHNVLLTYQKAPHDKSEVWTSQWQEYDLDEEDVAFLHEVNQGGTQSRLTWSQLETMLWNLEVQTAEASERSLQGAPRWRLH